jgi:hypothetical protein
MQARLRGISNKLDREGRGGRNSAGAAARHNQRRAFEMLLMLAHPGRGACPGVELTETAEITNALIISRSFTRQNPCTRSAMKRTLPFSLSHSLPDSIRVTVSRIIQENKT